MIKLAIFDDIKTAADNLVEKLRTVSDM